MQEASLCFLFWIHLEPQNAFRKHCFDFLAHFWRFWSKNVIFGFKIASEAMEIKKTGAVLSVVVVRTRNYARLKALMMQCFKYPHHGVTMPRKFSTAI